MLRTRKTVITASTVVALATAGAGCTTAVTVSKPNAAPRASSSAPAPSPSHTSNPTTGPVGTTFKITDPEAGPNDDQTAVYTIQAVKVLDPAAPDNSFDAAPSGHRLVGIEFIIKGVSGSEQDDIDGAVVTGGNNQTYQAGFTGLAAGTNFNSGDFTTSPGSTADGWVSFQVPNGVTVQNIQWTPDGGVNGGTVTWTGGS